MTPSLDRTAEWTALEEHRASLASTRLAELFSADTGRATVMSVAAGDLFLDYSKNAVTTETIQLLIALAMRAGLPEAIDAMFGGEHINETEDRAVLHVALRAAPDDRYLVDGTDVVPDVHDVLSRLGAFATSVRDGSWLGATGQPMSAVVNIGIGGSHLGPEMAYRALRPFADGPDVRFVSNVDGHDLVEALRGLDPATTLFLVSSKTFTTSETITNANSAKRWLVEALGQHAVGRHFAAVSTNREAVAAFGIDPANMFGFWDWVGGRFSVDSAIGASLMIGIGADRFGEFLSGMRAMDRHFRNAPPSENLPLLLALIGVWHRNFIGAPTVAVLPYSNDLRLLPAFLQQLDMESNGKSTRMDGERVTWDTGPVVWGEPGTNGQHAFFQLIHQGTQVIPCDFIGFARASNAVAGHQDLLIANMIAQAEALAFGREHQNPHRVFDGNRPSNTLFAPELTPAVLGQLVATYEHKIFAQGVIWGVNSFDQWGVELGKELAGAIAQELTAGRVDATAHDPSTAALIGRYLELRGP